VQCESCPANTSNIIRLSNLDCKRCTITSPHPTLDPIYQSSTKPLMYFCTFVLFLTYAIGLLFTLGTHTHKIYPKKNGKKRPQEMGSPLIAPNVAEGLRKRKSQKKFDVASPRSDESEQPPINYRFSLDSSRFSTPARSMSESNDEGSQQATIKRPHGKSALRSARDDESEGSLESAREHSDPGWGLVKAGCILMACTILYSLIAEILIDTLDVVLEIFPISEKLLGLTVFAIVPTVTEFCTCF
jgi:Ca2+:H+ antiporter